MTSFYLGLMQVRDGGLLSEAEFQEHKAMVLNTFVQDLTSCSDTVVKLGLRKSVHKSLRKSTGLLDRVGIGQAAPWQAPFPALAEEGCFQHSMLNSCHDGFERSTITVHS